MKNRSLLSALIAAIFLAGILCSHAVNMPLPRSTPEAQGISSQAISDYVEAADKINTMHSFMLVRHGHVIAEGWWKPEAADNRMFCTPSARASTQLPLDWRSKMAN